MVKQQIKAFKSLNIFEIEAEVNDFLKNNIKVRNIEVRNCVYYCVDGINTSYYAIVFYESHE